MHVYKIAWYENKLGRLYEKHISNIVQWKISYFPDMRLPLSCVISQKIVMILVIILGEKLVAAFFIIVYENWKYGWVHIYEVMDVFYIYVNMFYIIETVNSIKK